MKNTVSKSVFVCAALFNSFAANASSIDLETEQTLAVDASGLSQLEIKAGAGFIKLKGSREAEQITVVADLAVDKEHYQLSLSEKSGKGVLIAKTDSPGFNWFGDSAKIDLTITVPYELMVSIEDGSGSIEVDQLGNGLNIDDGSGSIDVSQITGPVYLKDGSGSILLEGITGDVDIEDGSGSLLAQTIKGSIKVDDGSGGIELLDIDGSIDLKDGSGEMSLKNIMGKVTIDDGSGNINLDGLENGLKIVDSGSGGLSMKNVKGEVSIDD